MGHKMPRTETPIKVSFWIFVSLYAALMLLSVTYVFYCYGLLTDLHYFGWGRVPSANMKGFMWLSDNLEWIATALSYSSVAAFTYLVYQTAAILERLGVNKHLSTAMTTASLFIPFYTFYRPWAGLGEVANTLDAAVSRRSIPFLGIRGTNARTVVLALIVYAYAISEKVIGLYTAEMAKRQLGTEPAAVSFLTDISFIFIVELLLTGILLGVVFWYWTGVIRNYHDALLFPSAADRTSGEITPVSSRDILQVGTRAAL
jgi:hypothetical protein